MPSQLPRCVAALIIGFTIALHTCVPAQPLLTPTQASQLLPLPPDCWPMSGTFWSLQKYGAWPPMPFVPFEGIDVFQLPDGSFVYDDSQVDYFALEQQREIDRALWSLEVQYGLVTAESGGPPLPGGGGGSGGPDLGPDPHNFKDYPTNSLWMDILPIQTNWITILLHGTVPDTVYEIWSKQALNDPSWTTETWVPGTPDTNITIAVIPVGTRTNTLFFWARSWGDADGNGLPDWWELQYFTTNGVDSYLDPDQDGWLNLQEYQNGSSPLSFDTPPAPTGLTVRYNGRATHVTAAWNPSQGPVQQYILERYIPELQMLDYFTNAASDEVFDDDPFPLSSPDLAFFPTTYSVQAQYAGGASFWSQPVPLYQLDFPAKIIRGPQGRTLAVVPGLPDNVATLRLSRLNATPFPTSVTNIDVPLSQFQGGVYEIPESLAAYFGPQYTWYIQVVDTNGIAGDILGCHENQPVPFLDGREQLRENLIFLLRAANSAWPFTFTWFSDATFTCPETYAYSGFHDLSQHAAPVLVPFGQTELGPFTLNALYRNFAFASTNDLYADGHLNTGAYLASWPHLDYPSTYMPPTPTNFNPIPPLLPPDQQQWIFSTGLKAELDISLDPSGTNYLMPATARNTFGLPYLSVQLTWGSPLTINTLYPGGSAPVLSPGHDPAFYAQTAEPQLSTIGYYFTRLINLTDQRALTPLPGEPSFSTNLTTPLLITSVGDSRFQVAGYAKQILLNGYSDKYAYLGQYFDKAYRANPNGTPSTNETGILSEYGDFFPTEPGPAILTTKPDLTQTNNLQGECTVHAIKLQTDVDHNNQMDLSFGGPDNSPQARPMVWWVNNDCDSNDAGHNPVGQESQAGSFAPFQDDTTDRINSWRDLEDFARLWICGVPALTNGGYQVTLSWANVSSGSPCIKLFQAVEADGGTRYLTDTNVAAGQSGLPINSNNVCFAFATVTNGQTFTFPANFFTNNSNKYFLFEGAGIGKGQLVLTITHNATNVLAQTGAWFGLHDVKDLYERAIITNNTSVAISNWTSGIELVQYPVVTDPNEDTNLIVYVHGGANDVTSWLMRSDTLFKRLYWAGYRGKVATVRWPSPPKSGLATDPLGWFNKSELNAYKAASSLKTYLNQLRQRFPNYRLNLIPQSLGGAVASEALSEGEPFDTLILCQISMAASSYDINAPTNADLIARDAANPTPEWQPMGYHGVYTNLVGRIASYYNTDDEFLNLWLIDQKYTKPGSTYSFDGTNSWCSPMSSPFYMVTDSQESRAMVSRSRTLAIGEQGPSSGQTSQGIIQSAVDIHAQFNIGRSADEHSAFFTRPIQTIWPLYDQILEDCLIPRIRRQ